MIGGVSTIRFQNYGLFTFTIISPLILYRAIPKAMILVATTGTPRLSASAMRGRPGRVFDAATSRLFVCPLINPIIMASINPDHLLIQQSFFARHRVSVYVDSNH